METLGCGCGVTAAPFSTWKPRSGSDGEEKGACLHPRGLQERAFSLIFSTVLKHSAG